METYYIYKFTNNINGKIYIGQSINPNKRKMEHLYGRKNKKNTYFDNILRKKGMENFTFEIIDKAYNTNDIDKLEKEYIKKFNSLKPNGYNICKGGRNQQGSWNSKPINEYDLKGNYIATYESASYYHNFINKNYDRRMITRSCNELKHYKERIFRYVGEEKPKPYKKCLPNHRTQVYQFDLKGKFIKKYNSVTEASRKTNTCRTTIMGCINGKYKTANNYIWSKKKEFNLSKSYNEIKRTEIYQCDLNKKIINSFNNTAEAERFNNLPKNSYKQILKYLDTNKIYKNFYWYRKKTYKENTVPSLN